MDPVTHAASGAVAMLALPRRPASRWAVPLAALAAASPDVDVLLGHSPLEFLLLHRGITHSLAFLPLLSLALTLLARPLWRADTPGRWSLAQTWLCMAGMVGLHIWLDCITTYGTMIFQPFSAQRIRLNAVFIIDFLLTLPLLGALWACRGGRARRGLMLLASAWLFVYPGLSLGMNHLHAARAREALESAGHEVTRLTVLPDALAPLFWRALYEERGPHGMQVCALSLNFRGEPRGPAESHTALPSKMGRSLAAQSVAADSFLQFMLLPVVAPLPPEFWPPDASAVQPPRSAASDAPGYVLVHDLRFGSGLEWVRRLMALRPNADIPFRYMAEITLADAAAPQAADAASLRLLRERLRFSDSGKDSLWQTPRRSGPLTWPQRLTGLR